MRAVVVLVGTSTLLAASPGLAGAAAAPFTAGATVLVSGADDFVRPLAEPDGDAALGAGAPLSDDGRYVLFGSVAPALAGPGDGPSQEVFRKDRQGGEVVRVSRPTGTAAASPSGRDATPVGLSDDGSKAAFVTTEPLSIADANDDADVYVRDLVAGTTTLASRASGAGAASGIHDEDEVAFSGDGTRVAYTTEAAVLQPGVTDANAAPDVYVTEVATGTTELASRGASAFATQGRSPSIADAGGSVVFLTDAPIAGALDTNGTSDAYLRVLGSPGGSTQLASRTNGGGGAPSTGAAEEAVLSGDGTTVAWSTAASDVGDGDTTPRSDVHRSVLGSGVTSLVSRNANGTIGDGFSTTPSISDDGATVAFLSSSANLDGLYADANGVSDAFVRRTAVNETELSSRVGPDDRQVAEPTVNAGISGDGRVVALRSRGGGLAPDLDPRFSHVAVRDQSAQPRITTTVSRPPGPASGVNAGGTALTPDAGGLSADGRYAVFTGDQPGRGARPVDSGTGYRRDLRTGAVEAVVRSTAGVVLPGQVLAISQDGHRVLFQTVVAADPADTNGLQDFYVRDVRAGTTTWATRADGAAGGPSGTSATGGALSGDGTRVAWATTATDLGVGDSNPATSVVVRDLVSSRTLLASRDQGAAGTTNPVAATQPSLDRTGRRVSFVSSGTGYGDGGTGATSQVHLRDLETNRNSLVSARPDGTQGGGASTDPALSSDGARVAFTTAATDLTGDDSDTTQDVLVKTLATGAITLASRADGPAGANVPTAANQSHLSADGDRVLFASTAALEPGVAPVGGGLYVRDMTAGTTRLATRRDGVGGAPTAGQRGSFSASGTCVLFTGTTGATLQAHLRAVGGPCVPNDPAEPAGAGSSVAGGGAASVGPTGTGAGLVPAARDRTAPAIRRIRLVPAKVRKGRRFAVTFRLSERARVTVTISTVTRGRRVGKACRRPTAANRRRRGCDRLQTRTTIVRTLAAGTRTVRVPATVRGRTLPAGTHVARLTARDAAGNRSTSRTVRFVVRR